MAGCATPQEVTFAVNVTLPFATCVNVVVCALGVLIVTIPVGNALHTTEALQGNPLIVYILLVPLQKEVFPLIEREGCVMVSTCVG